MRILVVGAGAIGGYFGGRLALAGQDVTFLVREARANELAANGLVIMSPRGDARLKDVKTVLAAQIEGPYDLVLLSCKAYDLNSAMDAFAPAVGPTTTILPTLNGMRHLEILKGRFGSASVLGGVCLIAATLDAAHRIVHMTDMHAIVFGELDGTKSARVEAIAAALRTGGFDVDAIEAIIQQMWEKWVFLATLAASTCLFRASVGDILAAPGGEAAMQALFDECGAVAAVNGHPMRAPFAERSRAMLFARNSPMTASMLRDIESGSRTEGDHVLGDLLTRRKANLPASGRLTTLELAYTHVKAYELRHGR